MSEKIVEVADALREAARYCRSDPGAAIRLAAAASQRIPCRFEGREVPKPSHELRLRLQANIAAGCSYALAEPDVFRGYLLGAAFELDASRWR